jgi:ribosomal protein S18 acetylase RimI-like enzyme
VIVDGTAQPRKGSRPLAFIVREATPGELAAVGELTHAAYTHDYADLPESYRDDLLHPERLVPDYEVWVAAADGLLVGTVSILRAGHSLGGRIAHDELYFRLLAVAPGARARGIGIALTGFALEQARSRGLARVVLNSAPYMLGAHALYSRLGFERVAEREHTVVTSGRTLQLMTFVRDV